MGPARRTGARAVSHVGQGLLSGLTGHDSPRRVAAGIWAESGASAPGVGIAARQLAQNPTNHGVGSTSFAEDGETPIREVLEQRVHVESGQMTAVQGPRDLLEVAKGTGSPEKGGQVEVRSSGIEVTVTVAFAAESGVESATGAGAGGGAQALRIASIAGSESGCRW